VDGEGCDLIAWSATMVLGVIVISLVLVYSKLATVINQSYFKIQRDTTWFSLAQKWRLYIYYHGYEVSPTSLYHSSGTGFDWHLTQSKGRLHKSNRLVLSIEKPPNCSV